MKKILVPIDFSQPAADALAVAYQLAQKIRATLWLVHVLEIPLPNEDVPVARIEILPMDYMRQAKSRAEDEMKALVKRQRIKDIDVVYSVQTGNPYRSIIRELIKNPADLIVMGSTGASGDREVWVGSNAERMVRFAHCPVLVVKEKVKVSQIKNIVFATSLREYDEEVMKALKVLQGLLGAHVHLVRINTSENFMEDPFVKRRLQELVQQHDLPNVSIHTYSDIGEEEGIINFAKEVKANLIALTTHGRRGLMHLLAGSIAEDVANHTKLPVWTVNLQHQSAPLEASQKAAYTNVIL